MSLPVDVKPLVQQPLLVPGLRLVLPEHLDDLLVPGGHDHRVEREQDVLLHGVDVLDVLDELPVQLLFSGHASSLLGSRVVVPSPAHAEPPELATAERRAPEPGAARPGPQLVDEHRER
jgi:hypothetical protein